MARNVRVLLAEDRPQDVKLTRRALTKAGLPVDLDVAQHGKEALDKLNAPGAVLPDIILLDWMMPLMNGEEVLDAIKKDPRFRKIPVIVLTTSESERDVNHAHDLGCNAYLVKPVDPVQFQQIIDSMGDFWLRKAALPK